MKHSDECDRQAIIESYMREFSQLAIRISGETGLFFETVADMAIGELSRLKAIGSAMMDMDQKERDDIDPEMN